MVTAVKNAIVLVPVRVKYPVPPLPPLAGFGVPPFGTVANVTLQVWLAEPEIEDPGVRNANEPEESEA
jgi:hypothetical protein